MGVDLTRNFYFSLTYNLAGTLQHNHLAATAPAGMCWAADVCPIGCVHEFVHRLVQEAAAVVDPGHA
jgi:hypothetical protein